jgi:hypothetical protein
MHLVEQAAFPPVQLALVHVVQTGQVYVGAVGFAFPAPAAAVQPDAPRREHVWVWMVQREA